MKPDWKDAPEWANYLAMGPDGIWWWYEFKPYKSGFGLFMEMSGRPERIINEEFDWENSLEERPK